MQTFREIFENFKEQEVESMTRIDILHESDKAMQILAELVRFSKRSADIQFLGDSIIFTNEKHSKKRYLPNRLLRLLTADVFSCDFEFVLENGDFGKTLEYYSKSGKFDFDKIRETIERASETTSSNDILGCKVVELKMVNKQFIDLLSDKDKEQMKRGLQ